MVAGLQHDATVSKLKLLELERAVSVFHFAHLVLTLNIFPLPLFSPFDFYFRLA
jgi:hypothetical protein